MACSALQLWSDVDQDQIWQTPSRVIPQTGHRCKGFPLSEKIAYPSFLILSSFHGLEPLDIFFSFFFFLEGLCLYVTLWNMTDFKYLYVHALARLTIRHESLRSSIYHVRKIIPWLFSRLIYLTKIYRFGNIVGLEDMIKLKKGLSRSHLTATRFIIVGMRLRGWLIRLRIDRSEAALK